METGILLRLLPPRKIERTHTPRRVREPVCVHCILCWVALDAAVNDYVCMPQSSQIESGGSNIRSYFCGSFHSQLLCLFTCWVHWAPPLLALCGMHYLFITQPITFRLCTQFQQIPSSFQLIFGQQIRCRPTVTKRVRWIFNRLLFIFHARNQIDSSLRQIQFTSCIPRRKITALPLPNANTAEYETKRIRSLWRKVTNAKEWNFKRKKSRTERKTFLWVLECIVSLLHGSPIRFEWATHNNSNTEWENVDEKKKKLDWDLKYGVKCILCFCLSCLEGAVPIIMCSVAW